MGKEQYVSFEVAKLLKEKGFNIPSDTSYEVCLWQMYDEDGKVHWGIYSSDWYFRITQQMACDWLREEHNIDIIPVIQHRWRYSQESPFKEYSCRVYDSDGNIVLSATKWYSRYENAVEAALEYCLKNII